MRYADLETFTAQFNSEETCIDALFNAKWPDGFRCPQCNHSLYYIIRSRRLPLYECRSCHHQTSPIAGTIMEGSSTLLTRWFQAIFLLSQPNGINSTALSKLIHVTYKTAWLMSHKIRHAIQCADHADPLKGIVRMHTSYYGYDYYLDAQHPLIIAGTIDEKEQLLQVKIKQPDPSDVLCRGLGVPRIIEKTGIRAFEKNHIVQYAVKIFSRSHQHSGLRKLGRDLTQWLNGVFGGIGAKHLQRYIDEFCFRQNNAIQLTPTFEQLILRCSLTPTLTYKNLTRHKPVLPVPWITWGSKTKWKGRHYSRWGA